MDPQVAKKITEFFAQYPSKRIAKHQILVHAGEAPGGIYHLIEGQVRQYDIADTGSEVVVNVFKPPAFFPMSWAINKTPNNYFFETSESTKLQIAPPNEVITFLHNNPDVMYDLLGRLYRGTDGMQRRMAHLMGGTAHSRVVFELLTEAKRFGKQRPDGAYLLHIHEDELARRAGLSRETVNRELSKLKSDGLLDVDHTDLSVKDLARLELALGDRL